MFLIIGNVAISLSRFFFVLSHVTLKGHIINGKEKHSGKNLRILFISTKTPSPHILNIIYVQKPEIEKTMKFKFLNIRKKINQIQSEIDAVFIKSDRFYSGFFEKQGFTAPF